MHYYTHASHHYTPLTMSHNNQQYLVHLIIQHRITSAQTSAAVCEGKGTAGVDRQRANGGGNRGKHLQPVIVTSIHSTNRTTGTRGEHGIEGGVQGVHVQPAAAGKQT